jgi:hypothetical protein
MGFSNNIMASLNPWFVVLASQVSWQFYLVTLMSIVLVRSQARKYENAPGRLLSLFRTRMDTHEKGTPLESSLNSFQTL